MKDFRRDIGELIRECASVCTIKERRTIEIKDIVEITGKEDVREYNAIQNISGLKGIGKTDIITEDTTR